MNKVIIVGRLTRDPEMRTTQTGLTNTTFTVAVSRNFTNQNGEREADFFNCVTWRKQAEIVAKYCSKGTQVAIEGRLQTRSYDAQDGTKRYVTEIIVDNIEFLGSRNQQTTNINNEINNGESNIVTTDISVDPYQELGQEIALSDDDLPF